VALTDVSFDVREKRTLAVVGETGAGKSTLARIVAGLDRPSSGEILVCGEPPALRRGAAAQVQMVFQDPLDALNPFLSIGRSVAEPIRRLPLRERRDRVRELFQRVGLDPSRSRQRPAGFSGGQLQRVGIARALAASPRLLVCDEPTSALDVSVQAQIVNLIMELQSTLGFSCILITHDLAVVRVLADEILVLRHGRMVERSLAEDFFREPQAEYSRSLLQAMS
jgi:ABC-type glutathione transport system ATPase component